MSAIRTYLPRYLSALLLTLALLQPPLGHTEVVELLQDNGLTTLARYEPGDADKPALLLLHGFLQTHNFSTIQALADELSADGYPVLAPTLSLNIDHRRQSLTCDALQTHSVEDSNRELAKWVEWLHRQGHTQIELIGHSSGSLRLLAYREAHPDESIAGLILLSLTPFEDWRSPDQWSEQQQRASAQLQAAPKGLGTYSLTFCRNNYLAPPSAILAYLGWTRTWVLDAVTTTRPAVHVILGGKDDQLAPDWAQTLRDAGIDTQVVAEGDHFFSDTASFELQGLLLDLLNPTGTGQ